MFNYARLVLLFSILTADISAAFSTADASQRPTSRPASAVKIVFIY